MAKKSFTEGGNPALQFISGEQQTAKPNDAETAERSKERAHKYAPVLVEVKSKRIQLALRPSLYKKAKAEADACGLSFNEYIHRVLENELKEE